jgi:hypothetical protein
LWKTAGLQIQKLKGGTKREKTRHRPPAGKHFDGKGRYADTESETEPEEENGKIYTGVIFDTDRSQEFTEEELERIEEKLASVEALKNSPVQSRLSKFTLPGFTMYRQENDIYCVPACVKSALKYITGATYEQSKIAEDMGTIMAVDTESSKIAPYMDAMQNEYWYVRKDKPTKSSIELYTYNAVVTNKVLAFMCIINPLGEKWHYGTKGHCLIINAIYSDKSKVQFADPLGGTQQGWPYYYIKDTSFLSTVCENLVW